MILTQSSALAAALVLATGVAVAQEQQLPPSAPSVLQPSTATAAPESPGATPSVAQGSPGAAVAAQPPTSPSSTDPSLSAQMPSPMPVPAPVAPTPPAEAAVPQVDPAEVAALREAYADLQRREREAGVLSGPVGAETQAAAAVADARATELDGLLATASWKADTMAWFVQDMRRTGTLALPAGMLPDMTQALALAAVAEGALYYDAPSFTEATLAGAFERPAAVLRIATAPGVQLVWVPTEGFRFMSSQSLGVYQ